MMSTNVEEGTAQVFSVGDHPRLSVDTGSNDIAVRAGGTGIICVRTQQADHAHGHSQSECFADGDHVHVRARGKDRHASFAIEVPAACAVFLHTAKGDIEVHGIRGGLEIGTVGGDVTIEDIAGGCRLHTVTGDIDARRLAGALSVQTTNGDTTVAQSHLNDFNLHSINGDFSIETSMVPDTHHFVKTTNGDVQLIVPDGTGLTVQLQSVNGDVNTDLPVETLNRSKRTWQARINGGGANLEMHSVNGDLRIRAGGPAERWNEATARASSTNPFVTDPDGGPDSGTWEGETADGLHEIPPHTANRPGATHTDTVAILAQLEAGDLTVEEAMARLDAIQAH